MKLYTFGNNCFMYGMLILVLFNVRNVVFSKYCTLIVIQITVDKAEQKARLNLITDNTKYEHIRIIRLKDINLKSAKNFKMTEFKVVKCKL